MLGCEICLEDISKISTSAGRLWVDCIKFTDDEHPLLVVIRPNKKDDENVKFLESRGYIKTTDTHRPKDIVIYLVSIDGVACKNPHHARIPSDLDLN